MFRTRGAKERYRHSRERLLGLFVGCPFEEVEGSCPFIQQRNLDIGEMVQEAYDDADELEVRNSIERHENCLFDRVSGLIRSHRKILD